MTCRKRATECSRVIFLLRFYGAIVCRVSMLMGLIIAQSGANEFYIAGMGLTYRSIAIQMSIARSANRKRRGGQLVKRQLGHTAPTKRRPGQPRPTAIDVCSTNPAVSGGSVRNCRDGKRELERST